MHKILFRNLLPYRQYHKLFISRYKYKFHLIWK